MKIEGEFGYNNDEDTLVSSGFIDVSHGELEIGISGCDTMEIELDMFEGADLVALAAAINQFGLRKIRHEENAMSDNPVKNKSSYNLQG